MLERERVNMDSESHSDESSNPEIPEWPPSDSDDEDADHLPANSIFTLVPSMQRYRNNLTALSQKYNVSAASPESRDCIAAFFRQPQS